MPSLTIDSLLKNAIPGGWTEQLIPCGDKTWNVLLPANADEFLNHLSANDGEPEPDVYWAQVWPPALLLGRMILRAGLPPRSRLLELGCGIGLPGLAALEAGADVTFSDYVPIAVELAVANASRNGFPLASGIVLDWKAPGADRFDWIIGSDILYDRHNHEALVNVLDTMLLPDGRVWIGDAGRYHVSAFIELAWRRGFDVELRDENGERIESPTSGKFQLLELKRYPVC